MGYIEDIEALDLSDDVKQRLIQAHQAEINPLRQVAQKSEREQRKDSVEQEVVALGDMGFEEAPGLLKFYRRALLSDTADEPGAVLLSDHELELSGDHLTGATGKETISVAGALRKFVELMPKNAEGKLAIQLSEMGGTVTGGEGRPANGDEDDPEKKTEGARERLSGLTGRDLSRKARGKRYGIASVTGGGE